jgi:hypothetical protein
MELETCRLTRDSLEFSDKALSLDSENTLILIFGAASFCDESSTFSQISKKFPKSKIMGCSSAGEIFGQEVFDETLSIAIVKFRHTKLLTVRSIVSEKTDSYQVGKELAQSLIKHDLKSIFVLSDGLNVNGSDLVNRLNSILSPSVIVTGGLAADGSQFKRTWVLDNGIPKQGIVIAVGVYGDKINIGHGSKGGWDTFGIERTVT